jgi:hypothetical protein
MSHPRTKNLVFYMIALTVLVGERRVRTGVRQRDSEVIAVNLPRGRVPAPLLDAVRLGDHLNPDDMAAARLRHGCYYLLSLTTLHHKLNERAEKSTRALLLAELELALVSGDVLACKELRVGTGVQPPSAPFYRPAVVDAFDKGSRFALRSQQTGRSSHPRLRKARSTFA